MLAVQYLSKGKRITVHYIFIAGRFAQLDILPLIDQFHKFHI